MSLWDDVKHNLVSLYGSAAEKTNELAKVGSRRYDIFGLSREIERQFSEIGSHVYNALEDGRTDLAEDEVLRGLVAQVKILETELEAKRLEIERIRSEAKAGAAAAGSTASDLEDDTPFVAPDPDASEDGVEDGEWSEVSEDVDEEWEDAAPEAGAPDPEKRA